MAWASRCAQIVGSLEAIIYFPSEIGTSYNILGRDEITAREVLAIRKIDPIIVIIAVENVTVTETVYLCQRAR